MNVIVPPDQFVRDVKIGQIPLLARRGVKLYGHDGLWSVHDVFPYPTHDKPNRIVMEHFPTGERCL